MESKEFQRIEELFHQVRQVDPSERAAYLDDQCQGNLELRAEVESLLAHANGESLNLSKIGTGESDTHIVDRGPVAEGPGARIGPYKILQKIGEGGFGVVYMAEQTKPMQRKVALKIIKLGMDTKQVIARFEAERQALALMDHPNIAKVLDAGATETGRPYFVMELVKGISLSEYCDKSKMKTRDRLKIFMQICYAIQHAHQKGIIHRDLKPSNVLVTLHDTMPVPMVIDFGIAKATSRQLTEKTLFTEFRNLIGTPEYMSPDQAEISGLDVDTRSDIYSLGVILYELLTGTTPFDAETLRKAPYGEIQRIIKEDEPPKPSTRLQTLMTSDSDSRITAQHQAEPGSLRRLLKGDLDWIVMKALEKDRTRRYQTASEFAADIERYMNKLPVLAGPPSMVYKTRKFILRHQLGVVAGFIVALALIIGASLMTYGLVQARDEAVRSQEIADFLQTLFVSTDPDAAMVSGVDVEQVLVKARKIFGDDHAAISALLMSRAAQLQTIGNLESSEQMYLQALEIKRDQAGDDDIMVGTILGQLGKLQVTKGDNAAAEQSLGESLRIARLQQRGMPLSTCDTLAHMASVLSNQSRFDESNALYREAISLLEKKGPHLKLQIGMIYLSMSNMFAIAGRVDEAMAVGMDAIAALRIAVPEDSTFLIQVIFQYGIGFFSLDNYADAIPLMLEANRYYKNEATSNPSSQFVTCRLLLLMYEDEGDLTSALKFGMEGVAIGENLEEKDKIEQALKTIANLAMRIALDPEETQENYQLARGALGRALLENPTHYEMLNVSGLIHYRLGEDEKALEVFEVAHAYFLEDHELGVPASLAFMAMANFKLDRFEKARDFMIKLRVVMEQPRYSLSKNNQEYLAEAEALLSEFMKNENP